jgi:hypothetical protein
MIDCLYRREKYYYSDETVLDHLDNSKILHREGGPAIVRFSSNKLWYQNGKLHRLDGPAIEYSDGDRSWYYEGQRVECYTQEQFDRWVKLKLFW